MRNIFVVIGLGLCVLAAGCQKKLTKEESDLLKQMSRQNHETTMAAMKMAQQEQTDIDYHISNRQDQGWAIMPGSLKEVYAVVLEIMQTGGYKEISTGVDGVSGQVQAELANNNYLTFDLVFDSDNMTKVFIRISGDKAPVARSQIEYFFKQIEENLSKN